MTARPQLTPEVLVPRLGDYLVEKKLITRQDLNRALEHQQAIKDSRNNPPLLGQLLIEMKLIDRPMLDQAITEQIILLREALQEYSRDLEHRVSERTSELQEALRKLSELNLLKANFVSNISHELRTPLTHLKGYLELFVTEVFGPLTPEQRQTFEIMVKASDRLENLIEDLIMYSSSERDQITIQVQAFKINELFSSLEKQVLDKTKSKNLIFNVESQPDLPSVRADLDKISWVILHLIDNAIKFTPTGGTITLSAWQENTTVCVTVSDTGIGIPADKVNEIFEPFHQLDGSSTRKYGGTGLGLALVKKIITAHGSLIRVSSQVGIGSRFEFLLQCSA